MDRISLAWKGSHFRPQPEDSWLELWEEISKHFQKSARDIIVANSKMRSWGKILEAEGTIAHSLGKGLAFSEMICDIWELVKKRVEPGKFP